MPAADPEFDEYADTYVEALERGISVSGENKDFFARGRLAWLKKRLSAAGFNPRTILDYGCGTGSATPYLRELFHPARIHGVDISDKSLGVARSTYPGDDVQFDSIRTFQPSAQCDLAFCNGVFHHIPLDQRADALAYVFRSLRPGGLFALWENNPWNPGARLVMKRIPFDRDAIMLWPAETRRRLRAAGFEIVRTDFLFIFPNFLRLIRPLERSLAGWPLGAQYMVLGRKHE